MEVPRIKSVHFENYKVLRDATLPLGGFTLIVGPNGSGKSTAMQALGQAAAHPVLDFQQVRAVGVKYTQDTWARITIEWKESGSRHPFIAKTIVGWHMNSSRVIDHKERGNQPVPQSEANAEMAVLSSFRIFSFNAASLTLPVQLKPNIELAPDGSNLAGVLDTLRDQAPERFEALNKDLARWLPDFDHVLFDTPAPGMRSFLLRTRIGKHKFKAEDLSHGTLFALAFLTLAHLPNPPRIICFEDPEHGIHPRLLREIQDGMYRLAYPENYGDDRDPVQVIATTHSPYLLDLYKEHPEEVVIASKDDQGAKFERLSEMSDLQEFLRDAPLGEVWYSGVLGGVPVHQ
jgi:predicted ATPase